MRSARTSLFLVGVLTFAACANPPQAAIDTARSALDAAAQSADVVTYAPDSLRDAQQAEAAFETELSAQMDRLSLLRRFDGVQALADAAAAAAKKAHADAAAAKAQVARDAQSLIDDVSTAITSVESKVWAARRVPKIKLDIVSSVALVPPIARAAVEDARKDIAAGAFASAKAKLQAAKDQLSASEETLIEQTRIARSR